jgi:hypothetical protein
MHVLLKNVFLLLSVFRQCKLNTHLLFLQKTKKEDDDEKGAERLTAVDQNAGTVWCRSTYSGRSSVYKFPVLKKKTRGNKAYAAAVLDIYAEKFTLHFDPTKKTISGAVRRTDPGHYESAIMGEAIAQIYPGFIRTGNTCKLIFVIRTVHHRSTTEETIALLRADRGLVYRLRRGAGCVRYTRPNPKHACSQPHRRRK